MVNRASKKFIVVAYDISSIKRRNKVTKVLLRYGTRINRSVFECMMSDRELVLAKEEIAEFLNSKTDKAVFYPLCINCYSKAIYIPKRLEKEDAEPVTIL